MRTVLAVVAGPPVALVFAILATEIEFAGDSALFVAPVVGGLTTFVLNPDNPSAPTETYALALGSMFASFWVAYIGWIIWMGQYIAD